jgi:hypothetical protein
MPRHILHTVNATKRNPVIRVTAESRKDLRIIAAHMGETIQDVVARLAQQERERIEKAERPDVSGQAGKYRQDPTTR